MLESFSLAPIFSFAILVGVIVAVHEFGHFLVGLAFQTKIAEFSIGFGPTVFAKVFRGIVFKVAWLPLGGYVRFLSSQEKEQASPEQEDWKFYDLQPPWMRFCISFAGPLFNFVFCFFILSFLYRIGLHRIPPLVHVLEHHQAHDLQMQRGDEILEIGGESISSFEEIPLVMGSLPFGPSEIQVKRCDLLLSCEKKSLPFEKRKAFHHDFLHQKSDKLGLLPFFFSNHILVPFDHPLADRFQTGDEILSVNGHKLKSSDFWRRKASEGDLLFQVKRNPGLLKQLEMKVEASSASQIAFPEDLDFDELIEVKVSSEERQWLGGLVDLSESVFFHKGENQTFLPKSLFWGEEEYSVSYLTDLKVFLSLFYGQKKKEKLHLRVESLDGKTWNLDFSEKALDDVFWMGDLLSRRIEPILTPQKSWVSSSRFALLEMKEKVTGFVSLIRDLVLREKKVKDHIGGPAAIAKLSSDAYQQGLRVFLSLMALLSLNIGFLNLLPFPALDGGKMIQNVVEMVTGNSKIVQYEAYFNFVGFVFLFVLMIYVFYQDILRIFFHH